LHPAVTPVYGCNDEHEVRARAPDAHGAAAYDQREDDAVGQALDTAGETGKTYTPVRWLPGLRISGRPRPHATLREDAVTIGLGAYTLVALFWDGLRHNNLTGIDSFWSAAHIAMYLGLLGLGVWIALVLLRHQKGEGTLDFADVPRGYALAFVALPLAAIAGPADFTWHSAYGFENQIDSAYSPPHQGLFIAGALLAAIPLASAWQRRGAAPSLREHLPAAFSMASVVAVMLFVVHQLVPFYAGVSTTSDFQDDIAGRADAFAGGADAVHSEGLARALTHYGDDAFPYYFYSTHHTIGGILLFTGVLMGGLLLMRRRWRVPVGTLTVMCTFLALLWPMLTEYRNAELIPALVLAGVAGDAMLARLAGTVGPLRLWRLRLFAGLMPVVLWSLFFLCVALFQGGLGWGATLWVGVLCSSAGLGYAVSLLVFQPFTGAAVEQAPPEGVAV
jgi:hypothetical protein